MSMFIMLAKSIMYIVHVFPPILSVLIHAILIALYAVSVSYQTAPDTSDPEHPQYGAPWYITKPCSVAFSKSNIGYCQQAKASFAATVSMMGLFVLYFGVAFWSCFPSKQQREMYAEKQEKQRSRAAAFARMESPGPRSATSVFDRMMPGPRSAGTTGGIKSPMIPLTPRTLAFNTLDGTKDRPVRNHFSTPNAPKSPTYAHSPRSPGFDNSAAKAEEAAITSNNMYFPPPPKSVSKK
jgi:hypothetical protein